MDGGRLEKEKAEELKSEVTRQRKRGHRRRQNSRASISSIADIDAAGSPSNTDAPAEDCLPTPSGTQNSFENAINGFTGHQNIGHSETGLVDQEIFDGLSPTFADFSQLDPLLTGQEDGNLDDNTWEQLLVPNDPIILSPHPDDDFLFDFGFTPLPVNTPLPTPDSLLQQEPFATTVQQNPKAIDPQVVHYVDHVIPNVLAFLNEPTRASLRNGLLMPEPSSVNMVNHSTKALIDFYRQLGLERMTGRSDLQTDAEVYDNTSRASRHLRNAIERGTKNQEQLPQASSAPAVALTLIQLLLLQVLNSTSWPCESLC
jgi:hypothetical protein